MIGVRGGECGLEYWCEIQNHKKELSLNIREFRNFPGVSYVRAYVSCIFLHTATLWWNFAAPARGLKATPKKNN